MCKLLVSALIICTLWSSSLCYFDGDSWLSIDLYHSLDYKNPEDFTHRGNVTNADIPRPVQNRLKDHEMEQLKELAQRGDYYRLRAIVSYPTSASKTYLTAVKACNLVLAQMNDVLWLAIDANGFVNSITQTVSASSSDDCSMLNGVSSNSALGEFYTDVLMRLTELAPAPDTASFIQKVEREREQREKGQGTDNRGFFAKYWMYIVPVVLLVFISGATNQDAAK